MSYPDFLLDKRVVQRNIAKGIVKKKEYEKLLGKLPDVAANAEAAVSDAQFDDEDDDETSED